MHEQSQFVFSLQDGSNGWIASHVIYMTIEFRFALFKILKDGLMSGFVSNI